MHWAEKSPKNYWNCEGAENILHILYFNVKKLNILGNGSLILF